MSRSLLSRFNLGVNFRGLVGFTTVIGSHFTARNRISNPYIQLKDWPTLGLSRFAKDMTVLPGYNPLSVSFPAPRDQSSYACNSLVDTVRDGHLYDFLSKSFSLPPDARELLRTTGTAAAVPLILCFAAGDGLLVRPDTEKNNYASDFEYTKAVLRSGQFPPDCEVRLGTSRVRMSEVTVRSEGGRFALSLRATTTAQHLFDGSARWELHVGKDGDARLNIGGTGKAALFAIDGANNCIASSLWDTTAEKFNTLMTAFAKDPQVIERSADLAELRANVSAHAQLPLSSQGLEKLLRLLNEASGPLVSLKASVVGADVQTLRASTHQDIRAVFERPQVPDEPDFINMDEQQAITRSAASATASDGPLLQPDDLKSLVHPQAVRPVNSGESAAERRAREKREAEERLEAERLERERLERERHNHNH